jgi:hypothetical protein
MAKRKKPTPEEIRAHKEHAAARLAELQWHMDRIAAELAAAKQKPAGA